MPKVNPISVTITGRDKFSKKLDGIQKRIKKFRGGLNKLGTFLTTRLAAPMGLAAIASTKASIDLNAGMAKIATLIPGNLKRVGQLKTELQDLSIATGVLTGDLAEGAYAAISAWGDGAETIERMAVVTKAAQAGYASTEETLSMLASLTEIYGDNSAKATEHIADMAFVTNKLAIKAPFADMAASMGKVAPLTKQVGVSLEDMFAQVTALAGVTGSVPEVATQMSSFYTAIIKETPQMTDVVKKANKELGKSYKSASELIADTGTMGFLQYLQKASMLPKSQANTRKALTKTNEELGTSFKTLKAALKGADAEKFQQQFNKNMMSVSKFQKALGGRKEGLIFALTMLGERSGKYNEALEENVKRSGQLVEAHKEVTDGTNKNGHAWNKTKTRMLVFAQRMGDKLAPAFSKILDKVEPLIDSIEKFTTQNIESIIQLAKWTLIAIGATKALSGFLAVVQGGMAFTNFLRNINSVNTALDNTAVGAKSANKKVKKLSKTVGGAAKGAKSAAGQFGKLEGAIGAVAALGIGWTIGTALSDIFLVPQANRVAKGRQAIQQKTDTAVQVARVGTAEERREQLTILEKESEKYRAGDFETSFEDFVGDFTSTFTGKKSLYEIRARMESERQQAMKALVESDREKRSADLLREALKEFSSNKGSMTIKIEDKAGVSIKVKKDGESEKKVDKGLVLAGVH